MDTNAILDLLKSAITEKLCVEMKFKNSGHTPVSSPNNMLTSAELRPDGMIKACGEYGAVVFDPAAVIMLAWYTLDHPDAPARNNAYTGQYA